MCSLCGGTGYVQTRGGYVPQALPCPQCRTFPRPKPTERPCDKCGGTGRVDDTQNSV